MADALPIYGVCALNRLSISSDLSSETIMDVGPSEPPMISTESLHEINVVQSRVKQTNSAMMLTPFLFRSVFKIFSNLFFAVFPLSEKEVESSGGFNFLIIFLTSVSVHGL